MKDKNYGISPKKRFGQNFLTDRNIALKIVRLADIKPDDVVLEIGAGQGALTELLIDKGAKVIAVEIDKALFHLLLVKFSDVKDIEILNEDALKISYKRLSERAGSKLKVIANLPYNISTAILFKFLEEREAFSGFLLMLQKEVAERIAAKPRCKDYGILSVFIRLLMDVKIEFKVPSSAFYPEPKVDSAVIRLNILDKPRVEVDDIDLFRKVVRASFNQRRKTLSNALKALPVPHNFIIKAFEKAGIDPNRRGETLSVEEFAKLSNIIDRSRE
ncbi:MAG TPA: 16S rRNA (adenine(1518)-N(6)/adenine(1519)-N(6))-dimethyltransferase [Deltaproteobacteria bacterium]|nr:16S rRNA (adenine(1518)-N(6)/adenine(1519)-N(6))-dimethyltransferase [Deltaproteobacteria bacterium]